MLELIIIAILAYLYWKEKNKPKQIIIQPGLMPKEEKKKALEESKPIQTESFRPLRDTPLPTDDNFLSPEPSEPSQSTQGTQALIIALVGVLIAFILIKKLKS